MKFLIIIVLLFILNSNSFQQIRHESLSIQLKLLNFFGNNNLERINGINDALDKLILAKKKTDDQLKKTDDQLKELIGYNQNRDVELEYVISTTFSVYMENIGWEISKIDVQNIYDIKGSVLTEWDGIYYGTHPNISLPRLFFIETKQLFTIKKYTEFKERLNMMITQVLQTLDIKNKLASTSYITMARRLHRYYAIDPSPIVVGVVGGPTIEDSVRKNLIEDKISEVSLTLDQYVVKLRDKF